MSKKTVLSGHNSHPSLLIFLSIFCFLLSSCENPWMIQILEPKTIYFETHGGTAVSSQKLYKGQKVSKPSNPARGKDKFEGWYEDNGSFKNLWNFDTVPTGDLTLYAKWKPLPPGLYRGAPNAVTAADRIAAVAANDVEAAVNHVNANPRTYTLILDADVSSVPKTIAGGVNLTLIGSGKLSLSEQGSLFTISSSAELTIENNITIKGLSGNTAALIRVEGKFTMTGGTISGNTTTANGGGVYVSGGGNFTMSGNARVDPDNDVYLSTGRSITIGGVLNSTGTVATITPQTYAVGTQVLTGAAVGTQYAKFAVTKENGTIEWKVRVDGRLAPKNWTAIPAGNENGTTATFGTSNIQSIAYGNGRFVAGGADGKMAWSDDGISWTSVNSPFSSSIRIDCVAYVNGRFFAGGNNNRSMAWSTDGINWDGDTRSADLFALSIGGIAYGAGRFVIVNSGGSPISVCRTTWSNDDGLNWETEDITDTFASGAALRGIAYGGGKFVAVSDASSGGGIAWSTDGIDWGTRAVIGSYNCVTYVWGKFFAGRGGSFTSTREVRWSNDGEDWNNSLIFQSSSGGYDNITCFAYGGGKLVAVSENGDIRWSTEDGCTTLASWTLIQAGVGEEESKFPTTTNQTRPIRGIAYGTYEGKGRFVAVGAQGRMAYWFDD
ncbi:MAG: InlB B-repeat-containing protein [Treponema sp.]|nr:InlB B-repeat-containing protein [Treponema sp.]